MLPFEGVVCGKVRMPAREQQRARQEQQERLRLLLARGICLSAETQRGVVAVCGEVLCGQREG